MKETPTDPFNVEEATIVELQAAMSSGQLTARQLVTMYIERIQSIDKQGPTIKAILEINPAVWK